MIMKSDLYISHAAPGNIEAKICIIVADILEIDKSAIRAESRFREDLGADSLDIVNLIMAFSNAFRAEICDADVRHVQTIGEVVAYLERHLISQTDQIE
jgi:acyl carrier protein